MNKDELFEKYRPIIVEPTLLEYAALVVGALLLVALFQ